ncbi:TOMM precursor leader peptide-binding protein [Amylibacter sp. IMCC11727]|uniref:TOMM precursor leader peptide-binding protein n=1 Tax=Amylibacter sp. IMCC11727 TaxID=3039851 RepID=UPI00244E49B5|nr:TOMM precursor leader peptide-binding protein [Amylibacter sp. IMCC11727]WGI23263.1 TOMM precursor leader peptide-binding protein [Amylibacter sp. IMCC11727]
MSRIRLSPAASISPTGTGVILNSDLGTFQLKGADLSVFIEKMIPLLDGSKSREDIAASIEGYSDASVLQLLAMLEERGLLEPAPDDATEFGPQERMAKVLPDGFMGKLADAKVLIVGLEPWGAIAAIELAATGVGALHMLDDRTVTAEDLLCIHDLKKDHVGQARKDALANLLQSGTSQITAADIVLGEDGALILDDAQYDLIITGLNADDHRVLRAVTAYADKNNITTLHGHLDGQEAWIGPVITPGNSGCWECYRLRKLAHAQNTQASHDFDNSRLAQRPDARGRAMLAPMAPMVGQLLAVDALRLLGLNEGSHPAGSFRVHDMFTGKAETHSFVPMPWCDVCGGAAKAVDAVEPDLRDPQVHALSLVHDGDALRDLLKGWIDPRAGVLKDLTLYASGQDTKQPRTAGANLVGFTTGNPQTAAGPMVGSGKALTDMSAQIGAVGEAIERYSASRYVKDALRYAPIDELDGDVVDPANLPLYNKKQYQSDHFPCTPWDPKQPIHWAKGEWIGGGEVWVPALPTYFNFFVPHNEHFCQVSSNGLAAGGDKRDAAVRACYELLERDSFMLSWFAQLPARRLIVDQDLDPELQKVKAQIEAKGVEIEFWVMNDMGTGIPTVVCLGLGDGDTWGGTTLGLSCHADIRVAAQKALLEQAHFGPYLARIMKEEKIPRKPEDVRSLEDHALYYVPKSKRKAFEFMRSDDDPILYSETADFGPAEGEDAYDYLAKQLKAADLKIAAVDVTSPDVMLSPFRVARAVGEYVQPIHFGYHMRPMVNPRLQKLLEGREINPNPHPIA